MTAKSSQSGDAKSRVKIGSSTEVRVPNVVATFPLKNPSPILGISREGTIIYSNDACASLKNGLNCSIGQLAPNHWCTLISDVLSSGTPKEIDETYGDKTFLFYFVPIKDLNYVNIYGIDVTERKKAEDKLAQQSALLTSIIENEGGPIFCVDRNYSYLLFNSEHAKVMKTLFGADIKIGQNILEYHTNLEDRASAQLYIDQALRGDSMTIEAYAGDETLERRCFEISHIPIKDTRGNVDNVVVYAKDITESKQIQEKLAQHTKNLEQLVEERTKQLKESERLSAIGQTAGMVGHDLRNPLQSVEGAVYLAKEDVKTLSPENPVKQSLVKLLEMIEVQIHYMNKIVSDLQDFVKPITPNVEKVDVQRVVDGALSVIEIPEDIRVVVNIEEEQVMVDPELMMRVLYNLIYNAIQAIPKEGRVNVKAQKAGDSVLFIISDTGVGIPEDIIPKLFTPLFTTKSKGQGFGLAVCRRIVEAHNGEITFTSKVGEGTTFTVRIPGTHNGKEN